MKPEAISTAFRIIIGELNPPVLTIILLLLSLEWLTHRRRNWSLLLVGWLFNLLYIYAETLGESAVILGIGIGQFAGTNLSLFTSALFLAYFFCGENVRERPRSLINATLIAAVAVFVSLTFALAIEGSIWAPFQVSDLDRKSEAILYTPLILFSLASTMAAAFRLKTTLSTARPLARSLIVNAWGFYGFLQVFYYLKFLEYKLPITVVFGLAFVCKACIAAGLFVLYREEIREHYAQRLRLQYEGKQQLAFSWFAHELKNPVLAIRFAAETVDSHISQRETAKAAKVAKRLLEVTNNLVSVIESVKLAAEPFDATRLTFLPVNSAIDEALAQVRLLKSFEPSAVKVDYSANLIVCAVRENMVQVFSNLIRNGLEALESERELKGTPGILMAINTRKVQEEGRMWVRVRVIDFGPGISEEVRADIFQPYFSTKEGINRGLGLWIVRNFLEAFGGQVRVVSPLQRFGRGTMFEVFLPLASKGSAESLTAEDFWRYKVAVPQMQATQKGIS